MNKWGQTKERGREMFSRSEITVLYRRSILSRSFPCEAVQTWSPYLGLLVFNLVDAKR